MNLIQAADLGALSFNNANTAALGGITLRTDAGSTFAAATANFPSYSASGSDPVTTPARTPAVHYNTTSDSTWVWNATTAAWEKSGRNYAYNSAGRSGTNVVLTAANAGRALFRSPPLNSPLTLELPLYSTCLDGDIFDVCNVGQANLTVNVSAGSADTITVNSVTGAVTYVLTPGQMARFVRINTGSAWQLMFLASTTGSSGGGAGVTGTPGWFQHASGTIVQYGVETLGGVTAPGVWSGYNQTLPIAFPNAAIAAFATMNAPITNSIFATAAAVDLTTISIYLTGDAVIPSGSQSIHWMAIGY